MFNFFNFGGKNTHKAKKKNKNNKKDTVNKKTNIINKKKFKTLKCAPKQKTLVSSELQNYSCYSNDQLFSFKTIWNKMNSNKITTNNPKEIWDFFKNNLSKECYNELCWLDNSSLKSNLNKDELAKSIFRPFSPKEWKKKPYAWLSSIDIIKVMKQYNKSYKKFKFIGPSPIDFDSKELEGSCVREELCNFDLKKYYYNNPKKTKIGIIFNLDKHNMPGSHWVALFVDIKNKFIFYFDSNGSKVPKEVKILIERIVEQGKQLNIEFKLYNNENIEHQKKDGQCGVYTLYFIIQLLRENKTPQFFLTKRVTDELMKDYRNIYFNKK
jgi:hypothetical protein